MPLPTVPRKPYAKPEAFNPTITLMTAPERFFAKFGPTPEERHEMTKDNVYPESVSWEELKIHAAFRGFKSTTPEYEMQRLELGRTHEWDTHPMSFTGRL